MMTTVVVETLGPLRLLIDGVPVVLPASKKTRALLGYLVTDSREHRRDRLCNLWWDNADEPRAQLRWSLCKLRALVGKRLITAHDQIAFSGARVDIVDIRAALAAGVARTPTDVLTAVASRFRGDFLEGLDLEDCFRFAAWCVAEREAMRGLRSQVLAELTARSADPEQALRHARAHVAIDPLSEQAHLDVIVALGKLGRRRDGLDQYATIARLLETELRVLPSPRLEHARMQLTRAA